MHKLSMVSLTALLAVGGVLAFVVFVSPNAAAAPAPATNQPANSQVTATHTAGTNSSLLSQPPVSNGTGTDDGSGFDD